MRTPQFNHSYLFVLIGLPASGKTTFGQALKKELAGKISFLEYIDTDIIRTTHFGSVFMPENEEKVRKEASRRLHLLNKETIAVIVDDMNYYSSMRHEFFQIAKDKNWHYISISLETPLDICLDWNKMRGGTIHNDVIKRVAERFDIPGKKYSWDTPKLIFDLSRIDVSAAIQQTLMYIEKIEKRPKKLPIAETARDKGAKKKAQLDKKARELIGKIIKSEVSEEQRFLISKNFAIDSVSEHGSLFNQQLLNSRKKFVDWLIKNQIFEVSLEIFLKFLTLS
jgi:tRNA uridine 5-carbamoylmethylation protein Kti12